MNMTLLVLQCPIVQTIFKIKQNSLCNSSWRHCSVFLWCD